MQDNSPPPAPDPKVTGQAQAASNVATAVANKSLNMTNQYTPEGSVKYNQIGTQKLSDGFGGTIDAPMWESVQTYSPEQQKIFDTNTQTKQNIATIGRDQSARIGELLGKPLEMSNEAVESRLFDLGTKRLNPQFARDEETLRTRLANSGIRQGSAAWDAEMGSFGQKKNDAYNSLMLQGRGQAMQELLTQRNAPINEISALMSGSQVSQPNFVNTPQGQVAGVDYAGLVRDKYNADMQAWNAQQQSNNAMMGGLFSLAAAPLSMMRLSDRRLKSDIVKIGETSSGIPVYEYTIFGKRDVGVMADEVADIPGVVMTGAMGIKMVDYSRLLEYS